ncbi:uncharacterized protein LOC109086937 isoform X2 [Cyprinus carpio]|uniref:Uncharacterized protein LOC109086937 isoform X2 n=1 Tax=Cyprinus carpio TaxID=7962 RepID=A0A9R0B300_CYPCA|nr:uncharacterized protein LOC109086937 isoform X2 [Cyprinus carpio]
MPLTPFTIFILICGFYSRFNAFAHAQIQTVQTQKEVQRGSDVSLRCDVRLLSKSSTLNWEKDGEHTPNSTLMYNNSAYIILHTADERNKGNYYCRLMEDGSVQTVRIHTLNVTSNLYGSQTIYRQSPFHISPVNFNYSGTYRCITENTIYTTTIPCTIRVEPPDGVLRSQSVVLTCEVSEVTDSVTLVWFRMEGNRGVLVKQQIMTEKNNMLRLTVNLASYETDPLHWQCAVFTENTLRALALITISCNSSENSTVTNQVNNSHANTLFCCVLTLFTGILLGALMYYCYRKRKSVQSGPQESEPVYINISQMRNDRERRSTPENRENSPEIYRNIRRDRYGKGNMNKRDETPVTSDSMTYATIVFNKSRFQT